MQLLLWGHLVLCIESLDFPLSKYHHVWAALTDSAVAYCSSAAASISFLTEELVIAIMQACVEYINNC